MENQEKEVKKTNIKKMTLKELGPNLPCGVQDDSGALVKSIDFKRWRMAEEMEIGELIEENQDASMAQLVSMVIGTMAKNIGQHNFEKMKEPEKLLQISQMRIGDVFYSYMWLRNKSLGNELKLNIKCHECKYQFPFTADLNTVEVNTCEKIDDAIWDYYLVDPFEIRGKKIIGFKLGPARWSSLENLKGKSALNTGFSKANIFIGCMHGVIIDGGAIEQMVLIPNEIKEMSKFDIELLTSQLDENGIGPDMIVECKCKKPGCKTNIKSRIEWGYSDFFGISSQ